MPSLRLEGLKADPGAPALPNDARAQAPDFIVDVALHWPVGRESSPELAETVGRAVAFLLSVCAFEAPETAATSVARFALARAPHAASDEGPDEVEVRVQTAGAAARALTLRLGAAEVGPAVERPSFGTVEVLHETPRFGIYRLNVSPRGVIPKHVHRVMHEAELVLDAGLRCQGEDAAPGTMRAWPMDAVHTYVNTTDAWASVLCVDAPPFVPEDEILVDGELTPVPARIVTRWGGA